MPVHFLTEADHERLNRFPEEIAQEDLFNFFWLSEGDRLATNLLTSKPPASKILLDRR